MNLVQKAKDLLQTRRHKYLAVFDTPAGKDVLRDLARFCRAHETTVAPDARTTDILEGRREVWLRIQHHLQLSDDDLWDLYKG